jgi:ATP-dependent DNA ligase
MPAPTGSLTLHSHIGHQAALRARLGPTGRYPAIASAAAKLRAKSFTMDGEAVVTGAGGVAVIRCAPPPP